jgi:hypothetical protein
MTKNIIWETLALKKREEFKNNNRIISMQMLEQGEKKLRDDHENGTKLGRFRSTLGFDKIIIGLNCRCFIRYDYIYDYDKIKIQNFAWSVQPFFC